MQAISRGGGYGATKFGALCDRFVDMGVPVRTQVENAFYKIFGLQGQTIDVTDQAVFISWDLVLHNEEGEKTNLSNLIKSSQRQSGSFQLFIWRSTQIRLIQTASTFALIVGLVINSY